jgi:hypothetical protein
MQKYKSPQEEIKQLKALAHQYIADNNKLVAKIWDIDYMLLKNNTMNKINSLNEEKNKINEKIKSENYEEKIKNTLNRIKDIEIEIFGHSDIGSNSPYQL